MVSKSTRFTLIGLVLAGLLLLAAPADLCAAEKGHGSVGLQVVPTAKGDLVVLNVVPGAPAETAGLLPGDLIVQVDDFTLAGSDFAEVVPRYLWGQVGSSVTITYLRPGVPGRHTLILQRAALTPVAPPPGVKILTPEKK
ncbi:MAG TPA: PDZ domain-containing protein [Desulfuromonadales bacterium]|jgi:carboxyl-terminal processing protease